MAGIDSQERLKQWPPVMVGDYVEVHHRPEFGTGSPRVKRGKVEVVSKRLIVCRSAKGYAFTVSLGEWFCGDSKIIILKRSRGSQDLVARAEEPKKVGLFDLSLLPTFREYRERMDQLGEECVGAETVGPARHRRARA